MSLLYVHCAQSNQRKEIRKEKKYSYTGCAILMKNAADESKGKLANNFISII